ncbi:hypothetical protein BOTBODRAFT_191784 [Botryobasidium botryosum FD-172 SS1]|uniref:Uncharacterized protein n=1 Tax=Botryobasidium botryosum (strain FD-172 SS1) TaxID=930990 RepID=A0A067M975_BOTB1|nr:hypothetical protein BOTBODRAFT_191784 [Botryobasidium botryosum FD-172 SS1]
MRLPFIFALLSPLALLAAADLYAPICTKLGMTIVNADFGFCDLACALDGHPDLTIVMMKGAGSPCLSEGNPGRCDGGGMCHPNDEAGAQSHFATASH